MKDKDCCSLGDLASCLVTIAPVTDCELAELRRVNGLLRDALDWTANYIATHGGNNGETQRALSIARDALAEAE